MPRKLPYTLEKVTLRLVEGDTAKLRKYFPKSGYNVAARTIIHKSLLALDAKFEQELENNDELNGPFNLDFDLSDFES